MSYLLGLQCLRCGRRYPAKGYYQGCADCTGNLCSNLQPFYDYDAIRCSFDPVIVGKRPSTMWRYHEFLPVDIANAVSIGEGMTPLIRCDRLGTELGLNHLYVKEESRNPTWSFKDRMASVAVSIALEFGAPVIVTSSSGNGGAATAAYSAKAGAPCVVFATPSVPPAMRTLIQIMGAMLVEVPTSADRYTMVKLCVDELGWFPVQNFLDPPIGANPYGIDGYKTIAHEVCEQLGWRAPDVFISPVAQGDDLVGPWRGFKEFHELGITRALPMMIAAEVFGPLQKALEEGWDHVEAVPGGPTVAISVGGTNSTYQSLKTLQESDGIALSASDEEMMSMQRRLAVNEGIYAEASSVLTLAVAAKLRESGKIGDHDTIVALLTSGGLKHPEVSQRLFHPVPSTRLSLAGLAETLEKGYGFKIRWDGGTRP
jgi:threonine synthase